MTTPVGLNGLAPTVAMAVAPATARPIVSAERSLYQEVWSSIDTYGDHSPGVVRLPFFLSMIGASSGTVLDAGCGSGKGGAALTAAGFTVTLCDLTADGLDDAATSLPFVEACLWDDLGQRRFDYVYCCDVMEHIPTEYVMLTIARLLAVAARGLFLSISLVPDSCGVWVGRHLHQTVMPFTWWRDRLSDVGVLLEARDLIDSGVYLVRAR